MSAKDIEKQIVEEWNNNEQTTVVKYLKKMKVKGTAEHIGNKQYPPTAEWGAYNKQKSYAKTDIKIGKHKISLKSMNDHIMMAAKKNEAIATFMTVSNILYENEIPEIITELTNEMSNMVSSVSPISIAKAKKQGQKDVIDAQQLHGQILEKIEEVFQDPVFLSYFIKEVLTGELKFGKNSDGSATHIMHITDRPIMHSLDDWTFIEETANKVDIRIDFKSVQKIQGPERGMYRFWSVLQIISKHMIQDSVIYEDTIFSKVRAILSDFILNIKKQITSWVDLFEFLQVKPEIQIIYK